jgi:hypothetical protein
MLQRPPRADYGNPELVKIERCLLILRTNVQALKSFVDGVSAAMWPDFNLRPKETKVHSVNWSAEDVELLAKTLHDQAEETGLLNRPRKLAEYTTAVSILGANSGDFTLPEGWSVPSLGIYQNDSERSEPPTQVVDDGCIRTSLQQLIRSER